VCSAVFVSRTQAQQALQMCSGEELAPSAPDLSMGALLEPEGQAEIEVLGDEVLCDEVVVPPERQPWSDSATHMKLPMCCVEVFDVNFSRVFRDIVALQQYPGIQPGAPADDLTWCVLGYSESRGFCLKHSLVGSIGLDILHTGSNHKTTTSTDSILATKHATVVKHAHGIETGTSHFSTHIMHTNSCKQLYTMHRSQYQRQ
jgi:hypothetical protein